MSQPIEKRPYLLRILGTWGVFLALATLLSIPLGPVPPLGAFLSPVTGYLRDTSNPSQKNKIQGLRSEVSISIDVRGVPHIVANNDLDLAFGQGYATARDRLWQMELQTAAVAGKISEILGPKALQFDMKQRRLGFLPAAEAEIEFLKKNDPTQYQILVAYSDGVNAFIDSLTPIDYPIEYKLLDTKPQPWSPLKCALFHKQMSWILTGNYTDFAMTNTLKKFSKQEIENLFPNFYTDSSPILEANVNHTSTADLQGFSTPAVLFQLDGLLKLSETFSKKQSSATGNNGSNNWVVDGVHTSHGYPILANDPHLDLKLPSLWYEIQLTAPGINVYGVSLPGLPNVIIGFNENVSWGITNAGVDVADWYAMKFEKTKTAPRYLYGSQWKQSEIRKETIAIKDQEPKVIEVLYTHLGPVAQEFSLLKKNGGSTPISFALKWTGHSPSNEYRVFYNLNRAQSVRDMKTALKVYESPGQNFVLSDKTGSIGYVQAGRFPLRKASHGRFVLDGTEPNSEWKDFIPFSHLPQSWSPERGYLFSANQQPTKTPPAGYASGDWGFTSYLRSKRIAEHLGEVTTTAPASIASLIKLQNDVLDLRAKNLLPLFLKWMEKRSLSDKEQKALRLLSQWNYELNGNNSSATLWSTWWDKFYRALWNAALPEDEFIWPSEDRTMELILGSNEGEWPSIPSVPELNTLPDVAAKSLKNTIESLIIFNQKHNIEGDFPEWGQYRGTKIPHLANLAGFGLDHLPTGGNGNTVNAITSHHGPSWRMIVTWIDAQPKAWGIYPGGQSGDVGNPLYSNMQEKWLKGELDELIFVQQGQLKENLTLKRIVLGAKE